MGLNPSRTRTIPVDPIGAPFVQVWVVCLRHHLSTDVSYARAQLSVCLFNLKMNGVVYLKHIFLSVTVLENDVFPNSHMNNDEFMKMYFGNNNKNNNHLKQVGAICYNCEISIRNNV